MFKKFRNKGRQNDDGVIVLKETAPGVCGGTDATQDTRAPKEILSQEMTLFDVTSALPGPAADMEAAQERLGYVSAFAAPAQGGTFLFLERGESFRRRCEKRRSWALVRADVFPALVQLVRECCLAKNNGFHSETHGLPENFGGSVRIRYADGETISFSNNQTPILSQQTGERIAAVFAEAMRGERAALPALSALRELRFEQTGPNGAFTRAVLTLLPDGTGVTRKSARYTGSDVYESEATLSADTVAALRQSVEDFGLLAWAGLPQSGFSFGGDKALTFVFEGGETVTVTSGKVLPEALSDGFFRIEHELTKTR